jgi:hypothetical protein
MKYRGVRVFLSLSLVFTLFTASVARSEEGRERNIAAHYGLGVGAGLCSLVYGPIKIVYATLGTITAGLAWALTGGRADVAGEIMTAAVRGDYVVTPENLTFNQPLQFTGHEGALDKPADETSSSEWQ